MRLLGALFLLIFSSICAAAPAVQGVRLWAAPDNTRVVIDMSGPAEYQLTKLEDPHRIVVDLPRTSLRATMPDIKDSKSLVGSLRAAQNGNDVRLVLDLTNAVRPKSFLLRPNATYGHRLVIDLFPKGNADSVVTTQNARPSHAPTAAREVVVAIDAGHGGEDPGARGSRGTNEKDVVMSIARKLAAKVNREPGMRAVLIRDGDYYIGLRQRIELARKHKADLFISIHADAFHNKAARGSSVYTLSSRGATSEAARWLATRENSADLIGGVSLDDKDDMLASVLLDLSQSATADASQHLASKLLTGLKRIGNTHKADVQQAGFLVLKSPDIPSVLVETAFISNPEEERKLRDRQHQDRLAQAMLDGIRAYFRQYAPPGTRMAATPGAPSKPTQLAASSRQHVVAPGDTLSGIAKQYRVSMQQLRAANGKRAERMYVGDVLRIPGDRDS